MKNVINNAKGEIERNTLLIKAYHADIDNARKRINICIDTIKENELAIKVMEAYNTEYAK